MLPDFPKIKKQIENRLIKHLENQVRKEPLLSQIKRETHFEGNKMEMLTIDGELNETDYKEVSTGFSIKPEDVIAKGIRPFIDNFLNVAEEFKKQQSLLIIKDISENTEKHRQVIDGGGKPFSHEIFLQLLNKIAIEFDDEEQPHLPSIVVSPEMAERIKKELPKWEANTDYKKKFNEVIEIKRKEWRDRESNRKLVD